MKFAKSLKTTLKIPTVLLNICGQALVVKCSLEIIDFVIMSWSFESFYQIGGNFFYGNEVNSLLIPFSKESIKVNSIKSQPVRHMCRR